MTRINVDVEFWQELQERAAHAGQTVGEYLRSAVDVTAFIQEELEAGNEVLSRRSDGSDPQYIRLVKAGDDA